MGVPFSKPGCRFADSVSARGFHGWFSGRAGALLGADAPNLSPGVITRLMPRVPQESPGIQNGVIGQSGTCDHLGRHSLTVAFPPLDLRNCACRSSNHAIGLVQCSPALAKGGAQNQDPFRIAV